MTTDQTPVIRRHAAQGHGRLVTAQQQHSSALFSQLVIEALEESA